MTNNSSYFLPENGSPNYVFSKKSGDWSVQQYQVVAHVAKEISTRSHLGLRINYWGLLPSRVIDTRNGQKNLHIETALSYTYSITSTSSISLGGGYDRNKIQPNFNNKYQHSSTDNLYNLYINAGMASYIKKDNMPHLEQMQVQWNMGGQYLYHSQKSIYSLIAQLASGEDYIEDRMITSNSLSNKVVGYKYKKYAMSLLSNNQFGQYKLIHNLGYTYTDGKGKMINELSNQYTQNYLYERTHIQFQSLLNFPSCSMFKNISFHANYSSENKRDRAYAVKEKIQYVDISALSTLQKRFRKTALEFHAGASFYKPLTVRYHVGAAEDNIYTQWIGKPNNGYYAAESFAIPMGLRLKQKIKNTLLDFSVEGSWNKNIVTKSSRFYTACALRLLY